MKQLVKLWERPSSDGKRFRYYLLYTDDEGKRRQKSLGHSDRRKAERQRAQLEHEFRAGVVGPESMRLREFMERSLATTGNQIRLSTQIEYRSAMEDFIDVVGDLDFCKIRQQDGELFRQTRLDRGDSPATVAKKLRGLKRMFQLAVEREHLDRNPLRYVKVPRSPGKRIRIYSEDECCRILKAASQIQKDSILEWDIMITLALTTAMRKSELLNLTWMDVDFKSRVVEVSPKEDALETWEWRIKDTDRRTLPLKDDVVQLLVSLQDRRPAGYPYVLVPPQRYDHIQKRLRAVGRWTFSHARTSVINNFDEWFGKILVAAAIRVGTFHDLRRTAITNWFYEGLNIFDVMRLAGHAKYETTYRFYLQVKDGLMDRARRATRYTVSQELLQKCCSRGFRKPNDEGQQTQVLAGPRLT